MKLALSRAGNQTKKKKNGGSPKVGRVGPAALRTNVGKRKKKKFWIGTQTPNKEFIRGDTPKDKNPEEKKSWHQGTAQKKKKVSCYVLKRGRGEGEERGAPDNGASKNACALRKNRGQPGKVPRKRNKEGAGGSRTSPMCSRNGQQ